MPVKKKKSQKKIRSVTVIAQSLFPNDENLRKDDSNLAKDEKTQESISEKKSFTSVAELLDNHPIKDNNKYISQEFQAFGCHMATVLEDQAYTSLYIKLAKTYPRALLEQALAFVSDAESARSKAKLFMWKLNQLKKSKENKKNELA